jgi:hypothetical protein
MQRKTTIVALIMLMTLGGLFLRLWHIEFGLPHSFYADEPEIAEYAIKYTYEIKDVISNGNYFKLIPVSYVYGTFPSYLYTVFTMGYSKISNLFSEPASKYELYVAMRIFNAILSFMIVPVFTLIFYRMTKNKRGALLLYALLAFNWKLIVHAHYVNADILLTLLLALSFLTALYYSEKQSDTLLTIVTGVFLGLAIGTKITALISLPLFIWMFYKKGQLRNVVALLFVVFGAYALSNPFSFIFAQDFSFRIYQMLFKEGGLVFDSVDRGYFKYIYALSFMATLPILLASFYGISRRNKNKFELFLLLNVLFYLFFFSIQSRRVDRWMLPVLPIILYFSVLGFEHIKNKLYYLILTPVLMYYLFFSTHLLTQFQRWTPKSEAYLWMKENFPEQSTKLVYTEEGLDPMNKLSGARVLQYEVYASKNAQLFLPEDPTYYDYVIISSRPMENYLRKEVKETFPDYYSRWNKFNDLLVSSGRFQLVEEFSLSKPNLIPLSDVYIYRNIEKKELPLLGPKPIL